jgi:hypothetical protein
MTPPKILDVRFTVEPGTDPRDFLESIGDNLNVLEVVVLVADAFGRLIPDEATRINFTLAEDGP